MIQRHDEKNGLQWYSSKLLLEVPHAMFCRYGGLSQAPFARLNLSLGVGDRAEAVQANRDLVKQALGIQHLASAVQVHGTQVVILEDIQQDREYEGADALITCQAGVGLLIQQADCQALLLYDPVHQAIAAVHNGWRGSVGNILAVTIDTMQQHCGTDPADLRVAISPSLGPCCAEFIHYVQELPQSMHSKQVQAGYFDFWQISREQLLQVGVQQEHIEIAALCTCCDAAFFSFRRASKEQGRPGKTGRCGSVIALKK